MTISVKIELNVSRTEIRAAGCKKPPNVNAQRIDSNEENVFCEACNMHRY